VQAISRPPQRAPDGAPLHYERHRPEQTTLYRLVQQHATSFIAHTEANTGSELPRFIKVEFDAFLECGILAHGFLRLRCGECGHDKLLAFSCKRRGFCPSCGARRMSQTAAHLVDHVIPHVPVRQWVLSLPIPLRVLLAAQPELVTPVLQVVQRVVMRHLLGAAELKADEGHGGAVTLIRPRALDPHVDPERDAHGQVQLRPQHPRLLPRHLARAADEDRAAQGGRGDRGPAAVGRAGGLRTSSGFESTARRETARPGPPTVSPSG
jgi:Transposase zinc-binding domain